jgi:hypothetical protein
VFALALRDLMLVRREKSAWSMILVSLFVPAMFKGSLVVALFVVALPAYFAAGLACGVDYKYKADRFLRSLPVPCSRLVASRFVSALLAWATCFAITALAWIAMSLLGSGVELAQLGPAFVLSLAETLVIVGAYICSYYVFGFQSARWAIFIVFVLIGSISALLGGFSGQLFQMEPRQLAQDSLLAQVLGGGLSPWACVLVIAVGLVAYAVSYIVSVAAYRRKEF